MRQRGGADGLGEVVDVPAEGKPLMARVSTEPRDTAQRAQLTPINSAGSVASTASPKKSEMIFGGLFGSGRKMWWISGCLP